MNIELLTTATEDLIITGEVTTEDAELNAYLDYRGPKGDTGAKGEQGIQGPKGDAFTYSDFTEEQLKSLKGPQGERGPKGDTGAKGEQGDKGSTGNDGISPTITTSKIGKVTTITIVDVLGTHTTTINDGVDGQGSGDMLTSTYDTNGNGIVDNAEKVNNHTVESDVPSNAVFTDTTYTAGEGIKISGGVISNTQTSANWGNITGTLSEQIDLNNILNNKVDKVVGKELSSNDYTSAEKNKLTNLLDVKEIGLGLFLDSSGKLSNTRPSPNWGNITGTLSQQSDLQESLNNKANITHSHTVENITNFPTIPTDLSDLTDNTNILSEKQNVLTAGENVVIENNVISVDYSDLNVLIENTLEALGLKDDTYDSTKTYSVGDMIVKDHTIYECITAITAAEAWNSDHWTIVPIITN